MLRNLPLIAAVPIVFVCGIADGVFTNRWGLSEELQSASARLEQIPLTIGEWQGKKLKIEQNVIERGEIAGYILRDYVNRRSGDVVQILVICGAPGPTSVHTPDVCYEGAGYSMTGAQEQVTEEDKSLSEPIELWTASFRKTNSLFDERLRIYWSWTTDGQWAAPSFPRWHYAGGSALYKMYVIRRTMGEDSSASDAACMGFIRQFVPEVNRALF